MRVENQSLIIEGQMQFDLPEQAEALYADVRSSVYRRSFALSQELETDKIEANLKDGVLTVRIPKQAELRARRIEIQEH
jgi:HSP20 family protein